MNERKRDTIIMGGNPNNLDNWLSVLIGVNAIIYLIRSFRFFFVLVIDIVVLCAALIPRFIHPIFSHSMCFPFSVWLNAIHRQLKYGRPLFSFPFLVDCIARFDFSDWLTLKNVGFSINEHTSNLGKLVHMINIRRYCIQRIMRLARVPLCVSRQRDYCWAFFFLSLPRNVVIEWAGWFTQEWSHRFSSRESLQRCLFFFQCNDMVFLAIRS